MTAASLFDLSGRIALVTGASRGLGRSIALGLAEAGADLVVAGRDAAALADTVSAIEAMERRARPLSLDLRDVAAFDAAVADISATFGPLDILVNNAGMESVRASTEVTPDLWDAIVDTNLKGAFFLSQAVARSMLPRGAGAIVNLCSLTSFVGIPTAVPYGASKTGLLGVTRALSAEWAGQGVRVNAIAPGYFRTAMTEAFYQDDTWETAMRAKIPMGRFGTLDEVRGAVIFLVSDASAYITGQCLGIDGGFLASV
ncbi:SDR family NAD(P)-dependent oxidoreductase [Pseudoruegeria sp. SK021]|uniref:SDR family NAD(P)-dependent oxidoreductase n=1 Tax=Pseudoruegeria sp. SK021 TaxID=1933035 RepID=UPI000A22FC77|nr:glucose 1-dehydrogenase [Pseudoruegeria sp. SK021]OSP54809.1 2-deoxy-D-gluconate 3-dehydrogenase [Pseudoruegeria sp. SK021]